MTMPVEAPQVDWEARYRQVWGWAAVAAVVLIVSMLVFCSLADRNQHNTQRTLVETQRQLADARTHAGALQLTVNVQKQVLKDRGVILENPLYALLTAGPINVARLEKEIDDIQMELVDVELQLEETQEKLAQSKRQSKLRQLLTEANFALMIGSEAWAAKKLQEFAESACKSDDYGTSTTGLTIEPISQALRALVADTVRFQSSHNKDGQPVVHIRILGMPRPDLRL